MMHGGVQVTTATVKTGPSLPASIEFETRLVDSELDSRQTAVYALPQRVLLAHTKGGAKARSGLGKGGPRAFSGDTKLVESAELFEVAQIVDLAGRPDVTAATTKGAALQAIEQYYEQHPEARGTLQAVPSAELVGV